MRHLRFRLPESRIFIQTLQDTLDDANPEVGAHILYVHSSNEDPCVLHKAVVDNWYAALDGSVTSTSINVPQMSMKDMLSVNRLSRYINILRSDTVISRHDIVSDPCHIEIVDAVAHDFVMRNIIHCSALNSVSAIRLNLKRALDHLVASKLIMFYELQCSEDGVEVVVHSEGLEGVGTGRIVAKLIDGHITVFDTDVPLYLQQLYGDYAVHKV